MKKVSVFLAVSAAALIAAGCASNSGTTASVSSEGEVESMPVTSDSSDNNSSTGTIEVNTDFIDNAATISNPEPAGDVELIESFEEGNFWYDKGSFWYTEDSNADTVETEISEEWSSAGSCSALWYMEKSQRGSSTSFYTDALLDTDWTGVNYLAADILTEQPVSITIRVMNGEEEIWDASNTVTIGAGENLNILFDFRNKITNPEEIVICEIEFTGNRKAGAVFVDNIRLVRQ